MRKLALAALAVAISIPAFSVVSSNEAKAFFWDRSPTYVVAPACSRPRAYGYYYRPRVYGYYYAPRVYAYSAPVGWTGRRWWWW